MLLCRRQRVQVLEGCLQEPIKGGAIKPFPWKGQAPALAQAFVSKGQDCDPEFLCLHLLPLQGRQGIAALSPPAGMAAAPKCLNLIQLSWWETPVFSRVKADIVLVPCGNGVRMGRASPQGWHWGCAGSIASYQFSSV